MLTVGIRIRAAVAAAFSAALFGVRAANTGITAFFGFSQVAHDAHNDSQHDGNNDVIFHRTSPICQYQSTGLRMRGCFAFWLARTINATTIATIASTAAPPAIAAPTFKVAGAAKSVPMV